MQDMIHLNIQIILLYQVSSNHNYYLIDLPKLETFTTGDRSFHETTSVTFESKF